MGMSDYKDRIMALAEERVNESYAGMERQCSYLPQELTD